MIRPQFSALVIALGLSVTPVVQAQQLKPSDSNGSSLPSGSSTSLEYRMAVLNAGGSATAVPRSPAAVARFRSALDEVSTVYAGSREQIGSLTMAMWKRLQDQKIPADMLEMLEGLNLVAPSGPTPARFDQFIMMYYTLRVKGRSHRDTIRQLSVISYGRPAPATVPEPVAPSSTSPERDTRTTAPSTPTTKTSSP